MIIEFKLANYRSINAEQTLSFVAENARRHPGNLIPRPGYKLLKAAALFGANASGKSNFVKGIKVMREFVRDSATRMNEGDPIVAAEPFRLDSEMREAPSRFEITFVTEGIIFTYGFAVTRPRVDAEWLTAKREKTEADVCSFRRTFNGLTEQYDWQFEGFNEPDKNQIIARTLSNMLALSVGTQQKVERMRPAYRYIRDSIRTFDMSSQSDMLMLIMLTVRLCENDDNFRVALSSLLNAADTGVEDFRIETATQKTPNVQTNIPEGMRDFLTAVNKFVASTPVPRITSSRRDTSGAEVDFDFDDDSQGTRRFFGIAGQFLFALINGVAIVIDELDASMHPLLTRRLLELFQSAERGSGAQLLFTTHDASLLDEDLFRRDQIWLAEKCDNASTFFSLADIRPPVRNTESFLRNYLVGRYGGTPHLGLAFDDLMAGSKA